MLNRDSLIKQKAPSEHPPAYVFDPERCLGSPRCGHGLGVYVNVGDDVLVAGGVCRGAFLAMVASPGFNPDGSMNAAVTATDFFLLRVSDAEAVGTGVVELSCDLLGTFSYDRALARHVFAGDVPFFFSGCGYQVFMPSRDLLELIVNGVQNRAQRIEFGTLRYSEMMACDSAEIQNVRVRVSLLDISGKRTAMFGKTRLGKSNALKIIMQGMLEATAQSRNVGQLVFDVNGEYANDSPKDGNYSIASAYADRTVVYVLARRESDAKSRILRFNFFEQIEDALSIFQELLDASVAGSDHARPFFSVRLPRLFVEWEERPEERQYRLRKIFLFWAILVNAGFEYDEERLAGLLGGGNAPFNPGFSQPLRMVAWQAMRGAVPPGVPVSFKEMLQEIKVIAEFSLQYPNDPNLRREGKEVFDNDDRALQSFLCPALGVGPLILRPCAAYHAPDADDFINSTLQALDRGDTVILDLGGASERVVRYFARELSMAVFRHQEERFATHSLTDHFVQLYFEEAHMIFPVNQGNTIDVYSRFGREGTKFHIGIAYSTQSPSSVNRDLLAQTENFFIGHLSSADQVDLLTNVQSAFINLGADIMRSCTPGFMRILTFSRRYVLPVQVRRCVLDDKVSYRQGGGTCQANGQ